MAFIIMTQLIFWKFEAMTPKQVPPVVGNHRISDEWGMILAGLGMIGIGIVVV